MLCHVSSDVPNSHLIHVNCLWRGVMQWNVMIMSECSTVTVILKRLGLLSCCRYIRASYAASVLYCIFLPGLLDIRHGRT